MTTFRIAAAADIHGSEVHRPRLEKAFGWLDGRADLVLLAGDLTTHGEPGQAAVVADACRLLDVPVVAVLGNHDFHAGKEREVVAVLGDAGVTVLQRSWTVLELDGTEIGIAGTKGFVGGFPGSTLPDFGEALLRQVYAETTAEQQALAEGLRCIAQSDLRIVLLHYAPIEETVADEPLGIHAFLGSSRLGIPIAEYPPDIVLHGHAHLGRFEGRIGDVPVYNVAVHVTGRDFWIFELDVAARGRTAVEVE
ncbi:MAG TPA: metallophosphoesterase [Gaiellaceae bacterium]|nr:metallophosphoesterase [Gaiellaceae bacterium]